MSGLISGLLWSSVTSDSFSKVWTSVASDGSKPLLTGGEGRLLSAQSPSTSEVWHRAEGAGQRAQGWRQKAERKPQLWDLLPWDVQSHSTLRAVVLESKTGKIIAALGERPQLCMRHSPLRMADVGHSLLQPGASRISYSVWALKAAIVVLSSSVCARSCPRSFDITFKRGCSTAAEPSHGSCGWRPPASCTGSAGHSPGASMQPLSLRLRVPTVTTAPGSRSWGSALKLPCRAPAPWRMPGVPPPQQTGPLGIWGFHSDLML